jgi:hypothetical protein
MVVNSLNLGSIEDILKAHRKQYENGLPEMEVPDLNEYILVKCHLINPYLRIWYRRARTTNQDIGLDGYSDAWKKIGFPIRQKIQWYNYEYSYTAASGNILDRYKRYRTILRNLPTEVTQTNRGSTMLPDVEISTVTIRWTPSIFWVWYWYILSWNGCRK